MTNTEKPMNSLITRSGSDYRHKLCKCALCGDVDICTPTFDFYSEEDGGLLYCESCFMGSHKTMSDIGMNIGGPNENLAAGTRVVVRNGALIGESGIVTSIGRFNTLANTKRPVVCIVEFPRDGGGEPLKMGKMPEDLSPL